MRKNLDVCDNRWWNLLRNFVRRTLEEIVCKFFLTSFMNEALKHKVVTLSASLLVNNCSFYSQSWHLPVFILPVHLWNVLNQCFFEHSYHIPVFYCPCPNSFGTWQKIKLISLNIEYRLKRILKSLYSIFNLRFTQCPNVIGILVCCLKATMENVNITGDRIV